MATTDSRKGRGPLPLPPSFTVHSLLRERTFPMMYEMGWRGLIPIIPPGVYDSTGQLRQLELAPESKISRSTALGKIPGRRRSDGFWTGFANWPLHQTSAHDCRLWQSWGASIGYRCEDVVAFDCDVLDKALSKAIWERLAGDLRLNADHVRFGRKPKWLIPLRCLTPLQGLRLNFKHPSHAETFGFDVLGHGRQFVLWGVYHKPYDDSRPWTPNNDPGRGRSGPGVEHWHPYRWHKLPPRFAELGLADQQTVEIAVKGVIETVTAHGYELVDKQGVTSRVDRKGLNQSGLKGERELVHEALLAIPATSAIFVDYFATYRVCVALKAAAQDWPDEGRQLWLQWSSQWQEGDGDPDWLLQRWDSTHAPYALGAQYIYDLAARYASWNKAKVDFPALPASGAGGGGGVVDLEGADDLAILDGMLSAGSIDAEVDAGAGARAGAEAGLEVVSSREAGGEPGSADPDALLWGLEVADLNPIQTAELARFSDFAVADRFAEAHRANLRYVGDQGMWYHWTGQVWKPDNAGGVEQAALERFMTREAQLLKANAPSDESEGAAKARQGAIARLQSTKAHRDILPRCRTKLTISYSQLDNTPDLLNCPNGLVDLRTGAAVPRGRERLVTRMTSVPIAPAGSPPPLRWLTFLREVTGGDEELFAYLHRALGYTLWGSAAEHLIFFLHGEGGNGKSVLLNTVFSILGDYAGTASRKLFLATKSDDHPTTLASIAGKRMVLVPELDADAAWNERLLKEFSAGDPLTARFLYKDEFTFRPSGTLWFSGNDRPKFSKIAPAIERRFKLIEFEYRPAKPDHDLPQKLMREGPRILRWLVDGCVQWSQQGVGTCKHVDRNTGEYFDENDDLRKWINERCERDPYAVTSTAELHADYREWTKTSLRETLNAMSFGRRIRACTDALGDTSRARLHGGTRGVRGLKLKSGKSDTISVTSDE